MSRNKKANKYGIFFCVAAAILVAAPGVRSETAPTDVYYLALSVDNSLKAMFELAEDFNREKISDTLKPRNVFLKALEVAGEFAELNIGRIDRDRLEAAERLDASSARPENVYSVLSLVEEQLRARNSYLEYQGFRETRTPSDVFQMLRQISFRHLSIAKKKGLRVNWGTPEPVYEENIRHVMAELQSLARETEVDFEPFHFPKNPLKDIYPRYVFKLQQAVYDNIARYFAEKKGYKPIRFLKILDLDQITPADVLDVTHIVMAELDAVIGGRELGRKIDKQYNDWKSGRKIVPGDVIHLVQYNFTLTRKIAGLK